MAAKPTCEELKQRVQALEKELIECKRVEKDIRESEAQLQAILDNTTAVIYLKDLQGRYLLINRYYELLFHVTKEQIVGKTDYDLFPKEKADEYRANEQKYFPGNPLLIL